MVEMTRCRYCGEEIPAASKKCRYCGRWLDKDAPNPFTQDMRVIREKIAAEKKKSYIRIACIILLLLVIVSFFYLIRIVHQRNKEIEMLDTEIEDVVRYDETQSL